MKIVVHTMEYHGGAMVSDLPMKNYSDVDYHEYKRIYNECFRDMRKALQIFLVDCCSSKEELQLKKEKIYVLEMDNRFIGSVAIYDNEIDDLIVEKSFQRMGYGEALLQFAISYLQSNHVSPIVLRVADWNQGAVKMYLKNGFSIIKTDVI